MLEQLPLKYLIIDDEFFFGRVQYHADLHRVYGTETSKISGGGLFFFDRDKKEFYLYSTSDKYGATTKQIAEDALKNSSDFKIRFADYKVFFTDMFDLEFAIQNDRLEEIYIVHYDR